MPYSEDCLEDEGAGSGVSHYVLFPSANAFLSTWDRQVSRSAMPAGNCTASNMEFSLMGKCQVTKPLVVGTTRSTRSSARLGLASMCPGQCLWTWSPPWWVGTRASRVAFQGGWESLPKSPQVLLGIPLQKGWADTWVYL